MTEVNIQYWQILLFDRLSQAAMQIENAIICNKVFIYKQICD